MPRKKKGGQSPARVPSGQQLEGGSNAVYRPPLMASNFLPESSPSTSAKEDIVRNMQEMFSHLDPEVIYIVLSECDFKVEYAMDALLELSVAAPEPQPVLSSVSGFERTAEALLTPHHFVKPQSQTDHSTHLQRSSTSPTCFMTEDLDFLIDQEVQSLSAQENIKGQHLDTQTVCLTEGLQSLERLCSGTSTMEKSLSLQSLENSSASSPLDQLSTFEDIYNVVDEQFPTETAVDKDILSMDLIMPGHSSAFQVYKKQNDTNSTDVMVAEEAGDEDVPKSDPSYENMDSSASLTWNIEAPAFQPQVQEIQGSAFITPVASDWPRGPRHTIPWHRPNTQAHLRPHPLLPKSWALPPPQPPGLSSRLRLEGKILVLLRGPPGSGKSTLARALLEHNPSGVILSTDDYFIVNGKYCFDPTSLGEAHNWNHNRAKLAFERGSNPIIIDNTNMCGWEMKPYVVLALKHSYKVLFREPDTWWKNKPRELERRTKHSVPLERIRRMLCGYERFVTVKSILGSQMPERKQPVANETGKPLEPEVPCPDIVGESGEINAEAHAALPSLPDVSTSHDYKYFKDKEENADMDMGEFAKIISDSNLEPVITKDHCLDELPVAFSASIGQRMKRERAGRKSSADDSEPAESKDTYKSEEKVVSQQEQITAEESTKSVINMLDFEGDWPSTASLDQRQERRRERHHDNNNHAEKATDNNLRTVNPCAKTKDMTKTDLTELLKLFDLIQTGADSINTDSSSLSPLSASSGDNDVWCAQQSQSEIKERITGELPDCVFDSQAAGCSLVGENELDLERSASQNATSCGEVSESPEFESFGEFESSQIRDVSGSEERKQRHTRRSGKQCKLALTFTHNCLEPSVDCAESSAAAQSNHKQNLELKTGCKLFIETNKMADYQSRPNSSTQTESLDFAQLWRVNQNSLDASDTSTNNFRMLCSNPTRFLPEISCATALVNPVYHREVPYSVVHEKGTQVEEKEFGTSKDVAENLLILRRHFKQVTLDTLEDLYEKCQQDLEWTTNLLLDSGERFFRDDEIEEEGRSWTEREHGPSSQMLNTLQCEELTGSGPDVVVEEIQTGTAYETCQKSDSNQCDLTTASSILDNNGNSQERIDKGDLKNLQPIKESTSNLIQNTTLGETRSCGGGVYDGSLGGAEGVEGLAVEIEDDISSMNEVHRLLQAELEELEREEKDREEVMAKMKDVKQKNPLMDIKSVELKLPTELALQLTELFGPVGVGPDAGSPEDYVLQMDLNLAKLLHQKWKESIQERQKQAALSFKLLQESSAHWGKPQKWTGLGSNPRHQKSREGTSCLDGHPDAGSHLPFMDHWNVSRPHVSLRDIIKEEMVLQQNREKARQSQTDLDKRDGATLLKEDQLFALFPTIDRHFLQDIFRDHNYSLTQTELFLHSLLDEGPVKTVVAPEAPQITHPRSASRDREKKPVEPVMLDYQDTEDPEYKDFRAEANLQRRRQLESFAKAAEAYKQGHKEVASFYAQQGHLHGQRMREANHRAAVQIFERVNSSLLPQNILDLHGLHVDEALEHLSEVLEMKTRECERGLCRPQLSVITGRGNHSLGGVARIRPAVLDYLTNKHYRFTEPKQGLVLVSLK